MSRHLVPHHHYPKDQYQDLLHPLALEAFDPFRDLDKSLTQNLQWINQPLLDPSLSLFPEKYRITIDCTGYTPLSLRTEYKDGKLHVYGKEEAKSPDHSVKEIHKEYQLPQNAQVDKLASFVTGGNFVIEVPLRSLQSTIQDLLPKVVEKEDGKKYTTVACNLPKAIHLNASDPAKLRVTCKEKDLIIRAEDTETRQDGFTRTNFYMRCTLPEHTALEDLKCHVDSNTNQLIIEAPVHPDYSHFKHAVPIDYSVVGNQ